MKVFDRILTIVITATLTSAVWIVFGSTVMEAAERDTVDDLRAGAPSAEANPGAIPKEGGQSEPQASATEASVASAPARSGSVLSLAMPVEGVTARALTDSFFDPRGPGGARRHEAIDIMAPLGTVVKAAAPGQIAKIHRSAAGGKSVYVRSADATMLYFYAHLDAYAPGLKEGDAVQAGDALGTVGTTGNAAPDAPHLHFAVFQTTADAEWWEPANAVNPYPLLTAPAR